MANNLKEIDKLLWREKGITSLSYFDPKIEQLLGALIKSTFIITKQPSQILDSSNPSAISYINFLVGQDLGFVDEKSFPDIEVSLISGSYVEELLKYKNFSLKYSGFSLKSMSSEENVYFRNDKIKCLYKQENKLDCSGNCINAKISITGFDQKDYHRIFSQNKPFYLLFESKFNVIHSIYDSIEVLALSVPIIMNSNNNEYKEPYIKGKLVWYNAFGEPSNDIPAKVPWFQVAREIEKMFYLETYQSPTKENLQFMAKKAFRNIDSYCQDISLHSLTWAQFYNELLPEKEVTFWEWLLEIIELSKNCPIDQNTKIYPKYPKIPELSTKSLWKNKKLDNITIKEIEKDFKSLFLDRSQMDYTTNCYLFPKLFP